MKNKRRKLRAQFSRITDAAIEAFRAGDRPALDRALALRPWEPSPLDAVGPCPWSGGSAGALGWAKAVELREALQNHAGMGARSLDNPTI